MNVAAVGDNCVDLYDLEGKSFPGGNPVNVAVYLTRLAVRSSYIGTVGNDIPGAQLVKAIEEQGVDVSHVRVKQGSTAVTHVRRINGNRVFGDYNEGVMKTFKLDDDQINFICDHDLVVSSLWSHMEPYLEHIHNCGIPIVFDYSDHPESPVVTETLPFVDYAFFGLEGKNDEPLQTFMKLIHSRGPRCVVVTLGDQGSVAYDGTCFIHQPIAPCSVVDTMGAGDAFIAGFIRGLLFGQSVSICMRDATQSSADTIGYEGAW